MGRLQKRWIYIVKECLRKRFGCQASKEDIAIWHSPRDEALTLTRCQSYGLPELWVEICLWQSVGHMCGFDGILRGNCFKEEPVRRIEVEASEGKVRN